MPNQYSPARNEAYLCFIREQPCCTCGDDVSVEAHHPRVGIINEDGVIEGTGPGMAQKSYDRWAVPLCGRCHRTLHARGEQLFWVERSIDPLALALRYQIKVR